MEIKGKSTCFLDRRLIISVRKYVFFKKKEKICKNIEPNTNPMVLIYEENK